MLRSLSCLLIGLAAAGAEPASAAWHKASTKHFVIYADEKPDRLRAFATKLEKFDKAVRLERAMPDYDFGDGNRLTIYVLKDLGAVEKLVGQRNVAGFYVGASRGPLAVVAGAGFSDSNDDFSSDIFFFHEYAHHLMFQQMQQAMPGWMVEGFAEMMSTARLEKDGSMWLARPAEHRSEELFWGTSMPLETMLSGNYTSLSEDLRMSVYSRGWLLTHYLTFEPSRKGQLKKYATLFSQGTDPLEAARSAFGDIRQLDLDLSRYRLRRKLGALRVSAASLTVSPVEVSLLSNGAAEVLPLRLQSKLGVNKTTAEPLAARVRAIQARYRGDPLVETTLAEAELDAGNAKAAEAAADRALATTPNNIEAMIYKGRTLAARGLEPKDSDTKLIAEARAWFTKASTADPRDPEPLYEIYNSYAAASEMPPRPAIQALHRASDLVPQDPSLRMISAWQYLHDKDLPKARRALAPIAYNPHSEKSAAQARAMLKRIDANDAEGAMKLMETTESSEAAASFRASDQ